MSRTLAYLLLIIACAQSAPGPRGAGRGGYSSSHTYPSSHGYSGTGVHHTNNYGQSHHTNNYGQSHSYGQSNSGHNYPPSPGLSGNNPVSPSRGQHYSHTNQRHDYGPKYEVHHHYNYRPPTYVSYGTVSHPVYHGQPPLYVYEYRNSGSRFDNLLTGLALYNLGRMSANHYDVNRHYTSIPGERCLLGIRKINGDYEESRVDCMLMSSFIWEAEREPSQVSTNTITVTNTNSGGTTTTTVKEAVQVKGPSIHVTQGMTCYMIRIAQYHSMRKEVDCALLQTYATTSMHYNHAACMNPININLLILMVTAYYLM